MKKSVFVMLAMLLSYNAMGVHLHLAKYRGGKSCAVTMTFDDGIKEQATMVLPELQKRNLKATFAIIGGRVGNEFKHTQLMSWDDVRKLSEVGQEISSHGWLHRKMTQLPPADLAQEIYSNDSIITANTGKRPKTFVFPYNAKSPEVIEKACKGRVGARMFQVALGYKNSHVTMEKTQQWIDAAKKKSSWLITMTHGITIGYDALEDQVNVLWHFMDMLKLQDDSIWTATLAEVSAYNAERDSLEVQKRENGHTIIITPSLKLDKTVFDQMLTMVIENTDLYKIQIMQDDKPLAVYQKGNDTLFDFNPYGGKIKIQTTNK